MSSRSFRLVRLTEASVISSTVSRSGRSSLIYLCLSISEFQIEGTAHGRVAAQPLSLIRRVACAVS